MLASLGIFVVQPAPAWAQSCAQRGTPYNWLHESCLDFNYYPDIGQYVLEGTVQILFQPGFDHSHVDTCTLYVQLKSSYGGAQEPRHYDCTFDARSSDTTLQLDYVWGWGRSSCDVYWQYVWMDVLSTSGKKYYARTYYAVQSATKPPC
jgi:hypothetical protein